MRSRNFIFIIFIFALVQVTFLDYLKVFGVKPDLFLISVVIAAIYFTPTEALLISLFSGVLKDVFSINTFGINTFIFAILCFMLVRLSKEVTLDSVPAAGTVTFLAILICALFLRLVSLYSDNFIPLLVFLRISFLEAMYTALIFPLVFKITRKVIYA
jgi:rod shape-determining protein MreD